jgi:hypothetical protein
MEEIPIPKKRRGPPKGTRPSGRRKGAKNKATLERERRARLELEAKIRKEQRKLDRKIANKGVETIEDARAVALEQGPKLLKDIGAEFTRLFAGMAAYHQPVPGNPNADEKKFREYAALALQGAKDFAQYESPKLSAVMIGADVINEIEIVGGLPDEEDGGLVASNPPTIDESGDLTEPAPDIKKAVNE